VPDGKLPSDRRPDRVNRRLGAVKLWPGQGGACGKVGATANPDRPFCAPPRAKGASVRRIGCNKETKGEENALLRWRNLLTRKTPYKACSGFTHVTARRIAQPPKATFVTRLQPCQLPGRAARQLPDQSTTLWVDSSSTSDSRLRGALPLPDSYSAAYSMTSSARASSVGGKSRPIALAVLRFTTSSNLVGCSTGRVAGMAPRRTLAICRANCAKTSVKRGP
jgi:hypothetical protein